MPRRLLIALFVGLLASMTSLSTAGAFADTPSVSGRIPGDPVISGDTFDSVDVGYAQSEYFVSGTAHAYSPTVPLNNDGNWTVEASSTAPFTTRIVVERPIRDRDFNGTVVVEWFNVSGGGDGRPDWTMTHTELIRQGYAYVGVSAQAIGVQTLKTNNPTRYASLSHPGDSYSYDIYSQAGQAIRDHADTVLAGLRPERVIAIGESQSASRLVTYINAVHPLVRVYDGFLVHSRGNASNLTQAPLTLVTPPPPTRIRTDLHEPVLVFQTENDVNGLAARQPDSEVFRLWEVAGAAHFDVYGLVVGPSDTGQPESVAQWFDFMRNPTATPSPSFTCASPINSGPQTFVLRAAVRSLDRWIAKGTQPPLALRISGSAQNPAQYTLDVNGNVRGGVRTPAVDAPVATLSGFGQTGAQFCSLFGTTVPLPDGHLQALYGDHDGFVKAWDKATRSAVRAGFLLREDAEMLRAAAEASDVLAPVSTMAAAG